MISEETDAQDRTRVLLRKGNNVLEGMSLFKVDPTIQTADSIDTEDMNYSKYIHAATESLPHIVIQYINSYLLESFNLLSIVSIVVSGYQVVGTLFPFLFHKCNCRSVPQQHMVDIPVRVLCTDITFSPKKKGNDINCWFKMSSLFSSYGGGDDGGGGDGDGDVELVLAAENKENND